jgi:O-antigen/teichoic acid export membrane protein
MADKSMDAPSVAGSPRRRFSVHVVWTLAARVLMTVNSVAAGIVVARWLGAEGSGQLAVINAAVATIVQLGSAGLPSANTYFTARDRRCLAPVWANSLIFVLVVGGLLALSVMGLAALSPALFNHIPLQLVTIAAISIPFQLITLLGLNILLGLNHIAQFNFLDAAAQSLTFVNAAIALIILGAGLGTLVSLNTAAAIAVSLLVMWVIGRILKGGAGDSAARFVPDAALFKRMTRYGIKFHISVVAAILIFRADLIIVNHFRGSAETGVYAVASQMAMLLLMLPSVIGTLLMPRVASERNTRGEFTVRVTRHTAFVMFIICLAAVPASALLPLVYGAEFADATVQLLILLPGVYLAGVESVLVQHFSGTGLPAAIPVFWLITLATNVALNLAFVPTYGARAAASASTITYAMIFVLVIWYFRRKTGNTLAATLLLRRHELRSLFRTARSGASSR